MITGTRTAEDEYTVRLSTGVRDVYGREVGGVGYIRTYSAGFLFTVMATRDDSAFGAIRDTHHVATFDLAHSLVHAKLRATAKRVQRVAQGQADGLYRTAGQLRQVAHDSKRKV